MLLSAIGALSLFAIGAFGWNAMGAWQRYEAARHAQEFDAGVNRFITGLFEVLMERLYTNNGLQAVDIALLAVIVNHDDVATAKLPRGGSFIAKTRQ